MPASVIQLQNVSKNYRLQSGSDKVAQTTAVLNNINLTINAGEVVGLIGKNGAGKSTLLKILSGITKPSSGSIRIYGTVGSIIEIGNGFHPELTGRQNILMSGQIMGFGKNYIRQKTDEIIAFSGIENYIDQPVKNYSSGMFVRLAFSMLTIFETDILLLDEVLGVGDAEFKTKSAQTLLQLIKSGRTVIMASHNATEIATVCHRAVWIDNQTIKMDGNPNEVLNHYLLQAATKTKERNLQNNKPIVVTHGVLNTPVFILDKVQVNAKQKQPSQSIYLEDEIEINIHFTKEIETDTNEITVHLYNLFGDHVLTDCAFLRYKKVDYKMPKGAYVMSCFIPGLLLNKGNYQINLSIGLNKTAIAHLNDICLFEVQSNTDELEHSDFNMIRDENNSINSIIKPNLKWRLKGTETDIAF